MTDEEAITNLLTIDSGALLYMTRKQCEAIDFVCKALGDKPKGKWIVHNDYNENCRYGCNQCGNLTNRNSSFCPDCGADMRGDV